MFSIYVKSNEIATPRIGNFIMTETKAYEILEILSKGFHHVNKPETYHLRVRKA